jgi:hypothetical protein
LLVDIVDSTAATVLRQQAAMLLREQEEHQRNQAREFIRRTVTDWIQEMNGSGIDFEILESSTADRFIVGEKRAKGTYSKNINEVRECYQTRQIDDAALPDRFSEALFTSFDNEFRKNFVGVHRKIGRGIGFIAPQKGQNMRYVLGDNLLKALVTAIVPCDNDMDFDTFLDQLYRRYGLVIGPAQARDSGLMDRLRINEHYYTQNRDALLGRMLRAGLARQYSDATALVSRG